MCLSFWVIPVSEDSDGGRPRAWGGFPESDSRAGPTHLLRPIPCALLKGGDGFFTVEMKQSLPSILGASVLRVRRESQDCTVESGTLLMAGSDPVTPVHSPASRQSWREEV